MKYTGSCHCGQVKYEAEGEIKEALACNCSICSRKGSLLWFIPRSAFKLLTPEDDAATYTFRKGIIKHRFCKTCGIHPFSYGTDPKGNEMAAINLRSLENIELDKIPVKPFNGKAL
jgi:hypothetical protein